MNDSEFCCVVSVRIQFFFLFNERSGITILFGIAKEKKKTVTVFFVSAIHLLLFSVSVRGWITNKIVSVLFLFCFRFCISEFVTVVSLLQLFIKISVIVY